MGKTYILGVNIYMKSMFINMALFSAFLFATNSCQRSPVIVNPPVTKPVNVDKVGKNVNSATNLNIVAKKGVSDAQIELKKAKKDIIVMHPGPMNRGIEIEGSLADGPQSVITQQVTNGVAIRMAVLDRVGNTMAAR